MSPLSREDSLNVFIFGKKNKNKTKKFIMEEVNKFGILVFL